MNCRSRFLDCAGALKKTAARAGPLDLPVPGDYTTPVPGDFVALGEYFCKDEIGRGSLAHGATGAVDKVAPSAWDLAKTAQKRPMWAGRGWIYCLAT